MQKTSSAKLPALTALRFIAAACIVVEHSKGIFDLAAMLGRKRGFGHELLERLPFYQAVSFFFILSGFILAYVYPKLDGWRDTGRFFLARFARLWPVHLAALAFFFVLLTPPMRPPLSREMRGEVAANVALVHAWIPYFSYFTSFNPPSWSISAEVFFYLCFPLLIQNWERNWWWKLPSTFLLLCTVVWYCQAQNLPWAATAEQKISVGALIYINPVSRLFEFVLGMTVSLAWKKWGSRFKIGLLGGTLLELGAFGLVGWTMLHSRSWATQVGEIRQLGMAGLDWVLVAGGSVFSFALLIFVMALNRGLIGRFFSLPLPILLGEISFTLYLVHISLLTYCSFRLSAFIAAAPRLAYATYWLWLLTLSYLIWNYVEKPCRNFLIGLCPKSGPKLPTTLLAVPILTKAA